MPIPAQPSGSGNWLPRRPRRTPSFLKPASRIRWRRLAKISAHLTPELFAEELKKLPAGSRVLTTHIKTRFREQMLLELAKVASSALDHGITVEVAEADLEYHL